MRPCPALLLVLALVGQGCGDAPSGQLPDGSLPESDGGRLDAGAEAGSPAQPPPDAVLDAAPPSPRDGSSDAPLDAAPPQDAGIPRAADPCGTELDFVGGETRPSFGATPGLDAGALDLERPGAFSVVTDLAGVACNALPVAPSCLAQVDTTPLPEGVLHYSRAESFVFGVPPDSATNPAPEHNALQFYRGALSPASLVYMNGSHASWLTNGASALFGNADVVRVTKAVQTAKLLSAFYGAAGLDRYLPPDGAYFAQQGSLIRQLARK